LTLPNGMGLDSANGIAELPVSVPTGSKFDRMSGKGGRAQIIALSAQYGQKKVLSAPNTDGVSICSHGPNDPYRVVVVAD